MTEVQLEKADGEVVKSFERVSKSFKAEVVTVQEDKIFRNIFDDIIERSESLDKIVNVTAFVSFGFGISQSGPHRRGSHPVGNCQGQGFFVCQRKPEGCSRWKLCGGHWHHPAYRFLAMRGYSILQGVRTAGFSSCFILVNDGGPHLNPPLQTIWGFNVFVCLKMPIGCCCFHATSFC